MYVPMAKHIFLKKL